MAQDTRQENQPILSYVSSPTKIKTANDAKDTAEINKNNNNNYEKKAVLRQYFSNSKGVVAQFLVTGSILILTTGAGMPIGYSAVLLPQLAENNGTLHADSELGSWIASVHSLVSPLGSLLSGPLLDVMGRRGCLQLSSIPLCIGFAVIGMATSIPCILAGRLITGFAVGLIAVPAQVLIGEMADPQLRGLLVGIPFAAYSMGILFVYILGATYSWEIVAFCGTALPLLALLTLSLIPESPAWLVKRRRIDAAKKALLWLRGGDIVQVNTEIGLLEARAKADVARMSSTDSLSQQATSAISKILNPGVLKPLAIINIFNFLQILSGTYVIVFYGVNVISEIGGNSVDKYLAAVVTAAVRFLFCLVCCVLLLKVGRRPLGLISAIGTAVTCLILAGYMLAKKETSTVDAYVIGFCLLMYVAINTIGLMSLPGVMLGELLPLRARGIGGGSTFFIFNLLIFGLTKLFPLITERVGMTGVFTIFGASALLESVFIYVALPETKGHTLQQIEDYFQQGNVFWVTRRREPKSNDGLTIVNV